MFYHQVYAQISDTKVMNIVVCTDFEMANLIAKKTYGSEAFAVDCTYWACGIGDTYKDGVFISPEGKEREYKGSEAENITKLEQENEKLKKQTSEDNETILDHEFRLMELEG